MVGKVGSSKGRWRGKKGTSDVVEGRRCGFQTDYILHFWILYYHLMLLNTMLFDSNIVSRIRERGIDGKSGRLGYWLGESWGNTNASGKSLSGSRTGEWGEGDQSEDQSHSDGKNWVRHCSRQVY